MLSAILRAMRPKQWLKNGLIFAALVFDRKLTNTPALLDTIQAVLLFSLTASTIYLLNDIQDIEADRLHPKKKYRPIAAGELSIGAAYAVVALLWVIVLPLAWRLAPNFLYILLTYIVLNLSYSRWFKHIPIIDVLALASFYILRVLAGTTVIQVVRFSPWLYISIMFLALFMGIGKRRAELISAQESGNSTREVLKSYTKEFLDQLITIVLTLAIFTYSYYTFSAENLPGNHIMMLTNPFVIYAIFRYLWLMQVKGVGEAPEDIVLSDRPLQVTFLLWGLSILIIFYLF